MYEGFKFPANAMTVMESMIEVATFNLIPTEGVDNQIYHWPDIDPFSVSFEMAGYESLFFLSNVGFTMYVIYLHILAALIHIIFHPIRNKSTCVQKIYAKLGAYLYWNGVIRVQMELFLELAVLTVLNVNTVDWLTQFKSVIISNIVSVSLLTILCGSLAFYMARFMCYPR